VAPGVGAAAGLDHAGRRVQGGDLREMVRQNDGDLARSAAQVQSPASALDLAQQRFV